MHAYALDHRAGHVVEATPGYERSVAYRGMGLDLAAVDAWLSGHPEDAGNSVVWSLLMQAVEDTMPAIITLRDLTRPEA